MKTNTHNKSHTTSSTSGCFGDKVFCSICLTFELDDETLLMPIGLLFELELLNIALSNLFTWIGEDELAALKGDTFPDRTGIGVATALYKRKRKIETMNKQNKNKAIDTSDLAIVCRSTKLTARDCSRFAC